VLYHSILPMHSVIWGVLLDLIVLSLLTSLAFFFLQKEDNVLRALACALIAATIANQIVATFITILDWKVPGLTPLRAFVATLVAELAFLWFWPRYFRTALHGMLV
jgi:hypothetical protein